MGLGWVWRGRAYWCGRMGRQGTKNLNTRMILVCTLLPAVKAASASEAQQLASSMVSVVGRVRGGVGRDRECITF